MSTPEAASPSQAEPKGRPPQAGHAGPRQAEGLSSQEASPEEAKAWSRPSGWGLLEWRPLLPRVAESGGIRSKFPRAPCLPLGIKGALALPGFPIMTPRDPQGMSYSRGCKLVASG